jgi:hypothetical protein
VDRRTFLGSIAATTALPFGQRGPADQPPRGDRAYWIAMLRRLADPVLGTLATMPVEQARGANRDGVTRLEALGRLIAGIAPWLELGEDDTAARARRAIAKAVDPSSPEFLNFTRDRQPLVDAAFLAQGIMRAPHALRDAFEPAPKRHLVAALESTRTITPGFNNWLLFSATVEACLKSLGAAWDRTRVDYALRQHEQWYKGDGTYGDGPDFHWDYYNSFVIQPMLLDVLGQVSRLTPELRSIEEDAVKRAARYAAILERMISPEGTFPPIGRSLAYRFGTLQLLGQMALRRQLPESVTPAQVRGAMTAVIRRMIEAPGTFDVDGWLTIGFSGHQPSIGESYISTGSLYLCAAGLIPLGLPATDAFWRAPAADWTSRKAWSGRDLTADHAI